MNKYLLSSKTGAGRTVATASLALFLSVCFAIGSSSIHSSYAETKPDERSKQIKEKRNRLDKLKSPEERAESLMEIAGITLTFVSDAITANDLPTLKSWVEEYRQSVRDARDTMMASGLDSYKSPKGYKAIELTTRAHLRVLTDSVRRLSLDNRQPLEEAIGEVSEIRAEMLHILFP